MLPTSHKPKIGVLLFGNHGLRQSGAGTPDGTYEERMSRLERRICSGLSDFADLVYESIVYVRTDLDRNMHRFYTEQVDGVFALYLSWAPDALWNRFLRDMPEFPVLFASMVPNEIPFTNTFTPNDSVAANTVRGLVGSLQASGSIARYRRPMLKCVLGEYPEIMDEAKTFFAAAHVRACLKEAVIAHLSRHHEVMWSTYVDAFTLFRHLGPEVKVLANATVRNEMERIPSADAEQALSHLIESYPTLPGVDLDCLAASVRASIAVDRTAAALGADLVVMNDLDGVMHRELGLRPGFLPCPFGHSIPATPEGDIGAGVAALVLRILSGRAANVMEPGYINPETGLVDIGHGGPNDYTDQSCSIQIATDTRTSGMDIRYAGAGHAWQVIAPGVKTLLHLSQFGDGFKMACTVVEALPVEHFHSSFCHGRVRTLTGSAVDVFGKLMNFGVTQHFAVAPGDYRSAIRQLAAMLGLPFLEV